MVRNNEHMFKKMNLSPLAVKILTYLSRSPNKQYYVRKIAGITQSSVGGTHGVLKELFKAGLLDREKSGRNLYYKIRERNPAIPHFKVFINIQELNYIINDVRDKCKKIILFGSCAKGEDIVDSDVDLLVITEDAKGIKQFLKDADISGRKLKPIILLPHEFIKLKSEDPTFYDEVTKGIVLWRDENE